MADMGTPYPIAVVCEWPGRSRLAVDHICFGAARSRRSQTLVAACLSGLAISQMVVPTSAPRPAGNNKKDRCFGASETAEATPPAPSPRNSAKLAIKISHVIAPITKPTEGAIHMDTRRREASHRNRGKPNRRQPPYAKSALINVPITTQCIWAGSRQTTNRNTGAAVSGTHSGATRKATLVRDTNHGVARRCLKSELGR